MDLLAEDPGYGPFAHGLFAAMFFAVSQVVILDNNKNADLILKLTNSLLDCCKGDVELESILFFQLVLQSITILQKTLEKMLALSQNLIHNDRKEFNTARYKSYFLDSKTNIFKEFWKYSY